MLMTNQEVEKRLTKEHEVTEMLKQYAQTKKIEHYYDKVQWQIGKTYRIRVGHIYDLSKFWIVHLERELTIFQNYLQEVYTTHGQSFRISSEDIATNMHCIAYSDGNYYRSIIVDIPRLRTVQKKVFVFLIDFGFIITVHFDNLYYLRKKLYEVPRFAVRACINRIVPRNMDTWTLAVVKRFNELVSGKILLCVVETMDSAHKTLYITIGEVDGNSRIQDIRDVLLNEKLVRPLHSKKHRRKTQQLHPNTLYPFLFPTFEALEQGRRPSSVHVSEILKNFSGSQCLLKPYYSLNTDEATDGPNNSFKEKLEFKKGLNKAKLDCNTLIRSHSGNTHK